MFYVGVDIGTTAIKAVAFTASGGPVAAGREETPWAVTESGAEMDPHQLFRSVVAALEQLLNVCPPGRIAGVGVASFAESGILLDRRGQPVAPVIAWHDTRDSAEFEMFAARFPRDEFAAVTGLPLLQQWSLTKHLWLRSRYPDSRKALRRFNVAEWIVRCLGGDEATEQSLASRTGWLRLKEREWWPESLEWSCADESLLPPIVTAGTALGAVRADVGLPRLSGAVITVAGHDHQVAAIGVGAAGPGAVLDSCGTAEALVRTIPAGLSRVAVANLTGSGITVGWHVLADHWCLLGATQGGRVLRRVLAVLDKDHRELDMTASMLGQSTVRLEAPAFEQLDILGIDDNVGPTDLWRAALDTVTDQIAHLHDAMSTAAGPHSSFVVTGGWSNCEALIDAKKRRFGALMLPRVREAGARGAAMFASVATGATHTLSAFPGSDEST